MALDLPHGDDPQCVSEPLRRLKIRLNDSSWSSNQARARGLRRLGVAQIGSKGVLDEKEFVRRVVRLSIQKCVPEALRAAATLAKGSRKSDLLTAADLCEKDPTRENAQKARTAAAAADADAAAAAYAAAAAAAADAAAAAADAAAAAAARSAARDKSLSAFAEEVVQILIDMKAPGCQWLALTELEAA